ncbi:MAG TPA: PadR family transcriptional regulator [Vicinamibacterales bacterium]|nr:PadR family transcriptional regulator [Vicinamibacterales bacterium]
MSSARLTPVSYVVLGLIARDGPSTPYELKAAVGLGIAHFWPFPHSQIYSETEYLKEAGLLAEERENRGRRRRRFRLTDAGRQALQAWLSEPTSDTLHLRSYAFLKLYFGHFARPDDIAGLARAQVAALQDQLASVTQMLERLKVRPDRKWQMAVAEMYFQIASALLTQWKQTAASGRGPARRIARPVARRKSKARA